MARPITHNTDTIIWYRKVANTPRVPTPTVNMWARKAQQGSKYHLRKLETVMYRVAARTVMRLANKNGMQTQDREDLYQVASLAAFQSLESWDSRKGSFLTHSYNRAKYACMNTISNESSLIRIPRNLTRHAHDIRRGHTTIEYVIERYGWSRKTLEWALRAMGTTHLDSSTEHPEFSPRQYDQYDVDSHFDKELIQHLRHMSRLTWREDFIIECLLKSDRKMTYQDIADLLEISSQAVGQTKERAFTKMFHAYWVYFGGKGRWTPPEDAATTHAEQLEMVGQ